MAREQAAFTIDPEAKQTLDALAFVLDTPKSHIVERGIDGVLEGLSPAQREAVEKVRAAKRAR